jgi:hypothetical protein
LVVLGEPDDIKKSRGCQIPRELHIVVRSVLIKVSREKMNLPLEVSEVLLLGSLVHIDPREREGSYTEEQ